MSEQIFSQFHENKIPKTWLSPVINIRLSDWTLLVNAWNMVEVWGGWYVYDYVDYDKKKTYLIDVDWWSDILDDRAQNVSNILDAYPNKSLRKWSWWSTINNNVDTKQLARDVRKAKEWDMQPWTVGEHIFKLDTDEVIEAIDNIEIPDNDKSINEISKKTDNLLEWQKEIKWSIEKQEETLGTSVGKTQNTLDEVKELTNTQWQQISDKIDWISKEINDIEKIDYWRIEKSIKDNKVDIQPIVSQIEWLKRDIVDEIKNRNLSSMKEFIVSNKWIVIENKKNIQSIKREFDKSLLEIKSSLDIISEKEIDLSPIFKNFVEISQKLKEWDKKLDDFSINTKNKLEEQYKKSMKYIIYIAKNLSNINKDDLQNIRKTLSNIVD